jgi:hypothetical protein
LIHHTIGNFNIHPDKQAVTRINDSLSTLQQSRDLRIREAESAMRKLSRNLNSLSPQHEEAVAVHDSGKHAAEIVELDTKKFRIAKAASELEIESERLESELEMLKERLVDLESQGLEGDETTRREREADDATMYGAVFRYCFGLAANESLVCDSKSSVLWVSISSLMTQATSTEQSSETAARVMSTLSISTPNSLASFTQTTSGRRCKDDYHDGLLRGNWSSGVPWRQKRCFFIDCCVFIPLNILVCYSYKSFSYISAQVLLG